MWKKLLSVFKGTDLRQAAFNEALLMLQASHGMHRDAVAALHKPGVLLTDIYERDRQINRFERDVRRKILTHLSVSEKPDINMSLIITAIVIDIERIGALTKNIAELAATSPDAFDGGELNGEIVELEEVVDGMFVDIGPALGGDRGDLARKIIRNHQELADRVKQGLLLLQSGEALGGQAGRAVTAALYMRYLKRVSAHLKNVATSIVNPYDRIGFKEEKDE